MGAAIYRKSGKGGRSLNLDKVFDYINYSSKNSATEKEVAETFEDTLSNRTVREVTTRGSEQMDNIRYDFVKTLIFQWLAWNDKFDDNEVSEDSYNVIENTLLKYGFLE